MTGLTPAGAALLGLSAAQYAILTEARIAMIDVPPFADGAVAELRHGADGTVIADIRIPGPGEPDAAGPWLPPIMIKAVERLSRAQCEALSAVLRDRIATRLDGGG